MAKLSKGLGQLSGKHILVDKANTTVIIAAAVAAAVLVFSLFASKALIEKIGYQNDVISLRNQAKEQLATNIDATEQLKIAYAAFEDTPESVIGTADKNSKLVLDALPSKYDFPALATSLDGIITGAGLTVKSINGVDQETTAAQSSVRPVPVPIPFEFSAEGSYESVQKLITDLQRSIRPFKILSIKFEVQNEGVISVQVAGETAYQPATEVGIEELKVGLDGELIEPQTTDEGATQ